MGMCVASESGPLFSSAQYHEACAWPAAAVNPLRVFLLAPRVASSCVPEVPPKPAGRVTVLQEALAVFCFLFQGKPAGL